MDRVINDVSQADEFVISHAEDANYFSYPLFYAEIAANPDMRTLVEVGSWKGHSIRHLAKELLKHKASFELYAVDAWEKTPDVDLAPLQGQIARIYDIYNYNLLNAGVRTSVFDLKGISWETARFFKDNVLDFVFIDAGHNYTEVYKDIEAWLPKVREGGVLAGHDWHHPPVKQAIEDLLWEYQVSEDKNAEDVWSMVKTKVLQKD